jgi:hypothetical protein
MQILALALVAATAPALADAAKPGTARMWNPDAIATVAGTVEAVERIEMGDGLACVRLQLRTGDGVLQVRVAPDWYLAEQKRTFAAGERIEVKGSRITFAGAPALVAGEIVRGGERIVLRAADGKPAWAPETAKR